MRRFSSTLWSSCKLTRAAVTDIERTTLLAFSRTLCSSSARGQNRSSDQGDRRHGPERQEFLLKLAERKGYRSPKALALLDIDKKKHILWPGYIVLDFGSAPGSWSQVAVKSVGAVPAHPGSRIPSFKGLQGHVISVDLKPTAPIRGAIVLDDCDVCEKSGQDRILSVLAGCKANVVLCDVAPEQSGVQGLDHDNIVDLGLGALKFSVDILEEGGSFLCTVWQGGRQEELRHLMKQYFNKVKILKPYAREVQLNELFLLGTQFHRLPKTD